MRGWHHFEDGLILFALALLLAVFFVGLAVSAMWLFDHPIWFLIIALLGLATAVWSWVRES